MLAQELHKPVIKEFKRRAVYARFKDNICATNLAEMGSLSIKNGAFKYLLCVMDVFIKYALAKLLTDKKAKTPLSGLVGIVNEFKQKPNKLWVDHEGKFYNNLTQKRLDDNDILIYSTTHNEDKSVVAEVLQES